MAHLAALVLSIFAASAQTPDFAALNEAFGIPIWSDDNLWDDPDKQIARRIHWPAESRTSSDSSYRLYAGASEKVLGARPYSLALYGKNGAASRISMVFANKGDVGGIKTASGRVSSDYKKQIAADEKIIRDSLTRMLGEPVADHFGRAVNTRERVERWDWNGHAILLAAPRGEYVAVRIIPTAVADGGGAEKIDDLEMNDRLKARIEHRPNGDVILTDIPMVDQGPKGYCVPATWERALRYMGIPADMYVLAMAAQTEAGGGTSTSSMTGAAAELVARSGRRLVKSGGRITTESVARFIDRGTPVLWGIFFVQDLNANISNRSAQRRGVTDWDLYMEMLKPWRKNARRIRTDRENGHVCMIIGYNKDTEEIAISDSWGPEYAERWITEEEANAISQGDFTIIGK